MLRLTLAYQLLGSGELLYSRCAGDGKRRVYDYRAAQRLDRGERVVSYPVEGHIGLEERHTLLQRDFQLALRGGERASLLGAATIGVLVTEGQDVFGRLAVGIGELVGEGPVREFRLPFCSRTRRLVDSQPGGIEESSTLNGKNDV